MTATRLSPRPSASGYPVVLKASSDRIPHKTEARCVVLDVRSAEAAGAAYDDVMAAVCAHLGDVDIDGVLVSQQVPPGVEMIAGVTVDQDFGPLVLVGLGRHLHRGAARRRRCGPPRSRWRRPPR